MTGLKIALTGAVLFVVFAFARSSANDPQCPESIRQSFSVIAFFSLLAIPTGLIYQIWSH